jgi:hypothetical protein
MMEVLQLLLLRALFVVLEGSWSTENENAVKDSSVTEYEDLELCDGGELLFRLGVENE